MYKFHQIPTDTFVPISHDNSYLFTHYERVANFLAFNLDKNYKNILAKPVQNGFVFDWFSSYENLRNNNEKSKEESEIQLVKYWAFIDVINSKIDQLANSSDENNKNWANLLTKVFNHKDNFIFSNGNDICIVWGWKFDNNKNYKPNFVSKPTAATPPPLYDKQAFSETPTNDAVLSEENEDEEDLTEENASEDEDVEEIIMEELQEDLPVEDSSFLNFLKWFASQYWWLLVVLASLIILVFLSKTIQYNAI